MNEYSKIHGKWLSGCQFAGSRTSLVIKSGRHLVTFLKFYHDDLFNLASASPIALIPCELWISPRGNSSGRNGKFCVRLSISPEVILLLRRRNRSIRPSHTYKKMRTFDEKLCHVEMGDVMGGVRVVCIWTSCSIQSWPPNFIVLRELKNFTGLTTLPIILAS